MPKKKRVSGSTRMKEMGQRSVQVWFDRNDYDEVMAMAIKAGVPMATFVRKCARHITTEVALCHANVTINGGIQTRGVGWR